MAEDTYPVELYIDDVDVYDYDDDLWAELQEVIDLELAIEAEREPFAREAEDTGEQDEPPSWGEEVDEWFWRGESEE